MTTLPEGVRLEESGAFFDSSDDPPDTWQVIGVFSVQDVWRVTITLDPADKWTVRTLQVEPIDELPPGGVTMRFQRSLPLVAMQAATRQDASARARAAVESDQNSSNDPLFGVGPDFSASLMSFADGLEGRRRISELLLAEYAQMYVTALPHRRPLEVLAATKGITMNEARNRIRQARERGLLSRTKQGLQGGQLTPRATQLLERA